MLAGGAGNRVGIIVCGTGIGVSIAANKVNGIRCALCHGKLHVLEFCGGMITVCDDTLPDHFTAMMSRKHNDANVLALGGRVLGRAVALEVSLF